MDRNKQYSADEVNFQQFVKEKKVILVYLRI